MPTLRPRSIVSLVLFAFAVALIPFVAAVVTAVVQVDRFASESRGAVLNAAAAADESRVLAEEATEMQRALGQYAVLDDSEAYGRYLERREGFRTALGHLLDEELSGLDEARLAALGADEQSVFERIGVVRRGAAAADWDSVNEALAALAGRSREVLAESDALIQQRANGVTQRAESLQQTLLVISVAAVPATVILVAFFTVLITRPLRAIGREIRRLGGKSLDIPVTVTGPQDVHALAEDLEWLRRRLKALEEQKSTFLQQISHELKTPLTTIREGSDLLTESLVDRPEDAEVAEILRENGLRLQKLIEDLLQFARTQELALDLECKAAVNLGKLIGESIDTLRVTADAKDLVVETELPPILVRCDAVKIRSVIDNLLINAIKYTPPGGLIRVTLASEEEDAIVDIRDSGPGVAADERERIFYPFAQGSAEYQSPVRGTGLGLSIAREYVEAHGGSIELIGSEGGAHFRVVLPCDGPVSASSA